MLHKEHKAMFVGATVVGERGQIVIPVDARRALDINPGDRLVVLLPPGHDALMLAKAEAMQRAIDGLVAGLAQSMTEGGESEGDAKSAE